MTSSTQWPGVMDLPINDPPTDAPRYANEIPSEDDMGFNDPENILYVNMEGEGIPARFKDRMDELEQMLQLTHQLCTIHAGIQVMQRKQEGTLPTEDTEEARWKRSQYRARVLDTYFNNGVYPWMFSPQWGQIRKEIRVERSRFHWELLSTMLAGILLPRPIAASLEAIFKSISNTINDSSFTRDSRSFFSMLQVYTYDSARDDLRASLRNITYTLDQQMYTVSTNKSSTTTIQVNFEFGQNNYSFNETTWRSMRPEVEKYINDTGIGNITNPPTVPV